MFRQFAFSLLAVCVAGSPCSRNETRKIIPLADNKIVGGVDVAPGELPYQLQLQFAGTLHCGASIISEQWVLTAAHCVKGVAMNRLKITAGSVHLTSGGSSHQVEQVILHEEYDQVNDIAVLRVVQPFEYNSNVAPVSLPRQGEDFPAGTTSVVSGWGAIEENGIIADVLQRVEVPIVSDNECNKVYDGEIHSDAEICAGFTRGGKDSCQGDSGGPLVADGVQVGIVSWGFGCARPSYPGVYTQVSTYRDWINQKTGV